MYIRQYKWRERERERERDMVHVPSAAGGIIDRALHFSSSKTFSTPPQLPLISFTCAYSSKPHLFTSFPSMESVDSPFSKGAAMRRVWRSTKPGKISDLKLVTEEIRPPAYGEVRVAIKSVGLNFADVATCLGLYSAAPKGAYIPGLEFAGVVESVGEGVDVPSVGEKVLGVTRFGAYSSHINISSKYVRSFPDNWSFSQAASFPVQGLTMIYALRELGNIQGGQVALVHSAAGGCGTFALGICKSLGVHVIATVGTIDKVKHLVEYWGEDFLPLQRIIVRDKAANFTQQLEASLSSLRVEGFHCILDAVLGDFFYPGYEKLLPGGRYIVYGASSMVPRGDRPNWLILAWKYLNRPILDPLKMMSENKNIMAFNLIWMFDKIDKMGQLFQELESCKLPPPFIGDRYPFTQALDAIQKFQSGKTKGKVVLEL